MYHRFAMFLIPWAIRVLATIGGGQFTWRQDGSQLVHLQLVFYHFGWTLSRHWNSCWTLLNSAAWREAYMRVDSWWDESTISNNHSSEISDNIWSPQDILQCEGESFHWFHCSHVLHSSMIWHWTDEPFRALPLGSWCLYTWMPIGWLRWSKLQPQHTNSFVVSAEQAQVANNLPICSLLTIKSLRVGVW